ncbi:hypothetical protein FHJ31_23520 [Pseudomonas sp. Fig-3]|nr:hypothetical protein FHJ31_23520 [Pseudomonas sp. Fig-3]
MKLCRIGDVRCLMARFCAPVRSVSARAGLIASRLAPTGDLQWRQILYSQQIKCGSEPARDEAHPANHQPLFYTFFIPRPLSRSRSFTPSLPTITPHTA